MVLQLLKIIPLKPITRVNILNTREHLSSARRIQPSSVQERTMTPRPWAVELADAKASAPRDLADPPGFSREASELVSS